MHCIYSVILDPSSKLLVKTSRDMAWPMSVQQPIRRLPYPQHHPSVCAWFDDSSYNFFGAISSATMPFVHMPNSSTDCRLSDMQAVHTRMSIPHPPCSAAMRL
jgi:hypothetical protein